MPTGYTADLEKKNYNLKKWLKESVIRAMGVCIMVRDNGDMTEDEIKKALSKKQESYHEKKLKEATTEVEKFSKATMESLKKIYDKARKDAEKEFVKSSEEFEKKSSAHLDSLSNAKKLLEQAKIEKRAS